MANLKKRVPENVPGDFFVDSTCIDCDACRQIAPSAFGDMPVGTPHSFKNEKRNPAKMLISLAPAGLEKMFVEVGVPLAEGGSTALPPTKEEIEKLLAVAPRYGIEIRLPGH